MKKLLLIAALIIPTIAFAASYTTNYGLYKPDSGDKNWGAQINNNFDIIDATVASEKNHAGLSNLGYVESGHSGFQPTISYTPENASNKKTDTSLGISNVYYPTQAAVKVYVDAGLSSKISTSLMNQANGIATLGADSKVTASQLPASLAGALSYKGVLSAAGGAYPGSPSQGDYYVISVAGTISGTAYLVGDWAVYNGSTWDKVDNSTLVSSVAGRTGAVVVTKADVGLSNVTDAAQVTAVTAGTGLASSGGTTPAISVASGYYMPQTSDQTAWNAKSTITGLSQNKLSKGNSAGTNIVDSTIYDDGTYVGIGTATPRAKLEVGISASVPSGSSPVVLVKGNLAVDGKIYGDGSLLTGTVPATRTITVSSGLTGGGDLSANRTIAVDSAVYGTVVSNSATYVPKTLTISTSSGLTGGGDLSTNRTLAVDASIYAKLNSPTFVTPALGTPASGVVTNLTGTAANVSVGTAGVAGTVTTAAQPAITSVGTLTSLKTSGTVGIGSTSPRSALDVAGNIYSTGTITAAQMDLTSVDQRIYGWGSYVGNYVDLNDDATAVSVNSLNSDGAIYGTVFYGSGAGLTDITGASSQWTGTSPIYYTGGNVGIGSSSPRDGLDVQGTVRGLDITSYQAMRAYWGIYTSSINLEGSDFNMTNGSGNIIKILNGGNVGVGMGTVSPSVLLQVGLGTRTAGPVAAATDTILKGALQVDSSIYAPAVTTGYALCFQATTKQLGHCTTTPTNGACTCVAN